MGGFERVTRARLLTGMMFAVVLAPPFAFCASIHSAYDTHGNLVQDQAYSYGYDSKGRLSRIYCNSTGEMRLLEELFYDYLEGWFRSKRLLTPDGRWRQSFVYDDWGTVLMLNRTGTYRAVRVMRVLKSLAEVHADGERVFYHPELQGAGHVFTDLQGRVIGHSDPEIDVVVSRTARKRQQHHEPEFPKKEAGWSMPEIQGYRIPWTVFPRPDVVLPSTHTHQRPEAEQESHFVGKEVGAK